MWLYLALLSALMLGLYDIAKKKASQNNGVLQILLVATALSTLFLSPWLFKYDVTGHEHLFLLLKAVIVTSSWISGMVALKMLPITTVSTLKATRPFLVVIFSILLFGERLNLCQWAGVATAFIALMLLSRSSQQEGVTFKSNKGLLAMGISILTGVISALYDKHIITGFEPMTVQSWGNFYITILLGICIIGQKKISGEGEKFHWDWTLLLIAVLITGADALYFFAIKEEGALLSVVSLLRRCSVLVTFVAGALFFKEKNLKRKSINILVLMLGMALLLIGSK